MDFGKILKLSSLQLGLVFLVSLTVFAWLQPFGILADPDSFYHIKITTLMQNFGLVKSFPWTTQSLYSQVFIDHHFGYHLLLMPFIYLFKYDWLGLQVATVVFASFTVTALAWCLKRWGVPLWGVGIALLLATAPFLFRLSLGKAPSVGVGVALVGYWLIVERKNGWVFWWTWFFTWLYSAWPLMLVMAMAYVITESALIKPETFTVRFAAKEFFRRLWMAKNRRLIGMILAGFAVGLVINPYFPVNLLYLKQLFTMALVAYNKFIGVGAEWYPYNPFELVAGIALPLLLWLLATVSAVFSFKKQTILSLTTWLLTIFFLVYTLRARRQVEYLSPWMVLSAGLMLRDTLSLFSWSKIGREFVGWLPQWCKTKVAIGLMAAYLTITIPWGLAKGLSQSYLQLRRGFPVGTYGLAMAWLKNNSPVNSVVFQNDWGSFPILLYHNSHNRYLTGLDQTFMYEFNRENYWQWVLLTTGEDKSDVYNKIKNNFKASYLLIDRRYPAMLYVTNRDERFKEVYKDSEVILFAL